MTRPSAAGLSRRDLLRAGLFGATGLGVPGLWRQAALASAGGAREDRTLVVVELAGGNDGLNTIVPYGDDAYHRARPNLAIAREDVLRIDPYWGFHPRMKGLRNLFSDGRVAIVHGCGYPNPSRSHFSALEYWQTAVPRGAEPYGWVGRLADARWPDGRPDTLVNITERESLAIRSAHHAPIVFSDPRTFVRAGDPDAADVYRRLTQGEDPNAPSTVAFMRRIARTAEASAQQVREATRRYETPISYGTAVASLARDLRNVAALLDAGFPARVYYVSMSGFDTHAAQADTQNNLLLYVGDALEGFFRDLDRQGRSEEVAMLVFTEFGRRVAENEGGGTDHGTATPMWLLGSSVQGGLHGRAPSLEDLDEGDLRMTTDFRSVYASVLEQWMGVGDASDVLKSSHAPLPLFAAHPA